MRLGVFAVVTCWLTPVVAVGLTGLGMSLTPALLAAAALAAAAAWWAARPIAAALWPVLAGRPAVAVVSLLVSALAVVQISREAIFIADSTRAGYSAMPNDPWRLKHCCMTAYAEAARHAQEGTDNIYDRALYQPRQIGSLRADSYHYPPPFLLLPRAFRAVTTDFFRIRDMWFAMQAIVLGAGMTAIALWIGGVVGGWALLGVPAALALPSVLYSLQMGNFQATAFPLAVLALVLLLGRHVLIGGPLLAYAALSKIFPGVLVVYLVAARRWRAVTWVVLSCVVLLAATFATFGPRPFAAFLRHELPAISDGTAFPQSEQPQTMASNPSVYGLTVRLRMLGVSALDQPTGLRIASMYGLLVLALALWVGWRHRADLLTPDGRLLLAEVALALMTLASFRSPFVGGLYGYVSTLWLLTLLAAGARTPRTAGVWGLMFAVLAISQLLIPSPARTDAASAFWLAVSGGTFLFALALNGWVAVRAALPETRRKRLPALASAPA